MSLYQGTVDGVHWVDVEEHTGSAAALLAGGKYREVRVLPPTVAQPAPVRFRKVPCATCGIDVVQQSFNGNYDPSPQACAVCQTDLDRPTRARIVGLKVASVDLRGKTLAVRFEDGSGLLVEIEYEGGLDVTYVGPPAAPSADLPEPFAEIPAVRQEKSCAHGSDTGCHAMDSQTCCYAERSELANCPHHGVTRP